MEVFDPPGTYVTNVPPPTHKPKELYLLPSQTVSLGPDVDRIAVGAPILGTGIEVLEDHVRNNAVDEIQLKWRRWLLRGSAVIILAALVLLLLRRFG